MGEDIHMLELMLTITLPLHILMLPSLNHIPTTPTVVEQFTLSRSEKLKLNPKLKPIHKPGMHTPDTTHTLTDTITDMPVTDILPTPMDTDMVDIHTTADTTDTTTENRFLVANRILDRSLFKAGVNSHP